MPAQPQVLTVTELTRRVKNLVEGSFPIVWVEGEISNLAIAPSGHAYFTLKDDGGRHRRRDLENQLRTA